MLILTLALFVGRERKAVRRERREGGRRFFRRFASEEQGTGEEGALESPGS